MPKPQTLLTIQQVADQLQQHSDTVRRAIWEGRIVGHRISGSIRISQADLDTYIKSGRGIRVKHRRKKIPVS